MVALSSLLFILPLVLATPTPPSYSPAAPAPPSYPPAAPAPPSDPPTAHAPPSYSPVAPAPPSYSQAVPAPPSHSPKAPSPPSHSPKAPAPPSYSPVAPAPPSYSPKAPVPPSYSPAASASPSLPPVVIPPSYPPAATPPSYPLAGSAPHYTWFITDWTAGCVRRGCFYTFCITGPKQNIYPSFHASCSADESQGYFFTQCKATGKNHVKVSSAFLKRKDAGVSPKKFAVSVSFDGFEEGSYFNATGRHGVVYNQFVAPEESFSVRPTEIVGVA
ncbi:MAG: hypothetical protein MMC23_005072 [Stictis urceolatum]|nr:hypothetical protein [Stictis urceolata]